MFTDQQDCSSPQVYQSTGNPKQHHCSAAKSSLFFTGQWQGARRTVMSHNGQIQQEPERPSRERQGHLVEMLWPAGINFSPHAD